MSKEEYYAKIEEDYLENPGSYDISKTQTYGQYLDKYIADNKPKEKSKAMKLEDSSYVSGANDPGWVAGLYDQNISVKINGKTLSGLEMWDAGEDWES
jgi:hypothetical protein